jgi:hypothetical protein
MHEWFHDTEKKQNVNLRMVSPTPKHVVILNKIEFCCVYVTIKLRVLIYWATQRDIACQNNVVGRSFWVQLAISYVPVYQPLRP